MKGAKVIRGVEEGEVLVQTPYDAAFMEELKALLPKGTRRWAPEHDGWMVAEAYEEQVVQLVVLHFGGCEVFGESGELDQLVDRAGRAVQGRLSL